ncbi:MAG: histidine kinase [Prevotellaceae bacterium]|jgi:sensor histidine kinase YesM|nr:histidine kinase [Prevotellaceae bacterium]
MEKNPIFKNYKTKGLYLFIWLCIICGQILIINATSSYSLEYIIIESVVFNFLYASLLIPVWYPVRFNRWEHKTWQFNVVVHLLLVSLFISLSAPAGYFIMWLLETDNNRYMDYLQLTYGWKIVQGCTFYLVMVLVYYLYIYVEKLREKAANEIRLNRLIKDNELNRLKSQINPHFLFNSLNSLNSLIIRHPEQAQKMLVELSDYLRYAVLANNAIYASLQHEMENIERYLAIEQLRFGEKLVYERTIDPACLPLKIPAMLLQPLFENAVKHGVYESLQTVYINISAKADGQQLAIVISNNYDAGNGSQKKGSGTGLKNIRERLRLSYGATASLHTKMEDGKFIAILQIPVDDKK